MDDIMKNQIVPTAQIVINKVNAMIDFTYPKPQNRYVVGTVNLFTGQNPSQNWEDIYSLYRLINDVEGIGGWKDKQTKTYYVDVVKTYNDLNVVIMVAKCFKQVAIWDSKDKKVIFV